MSVNALHIELPDRERPGLVPWIVVLLCAATLLVLVSQLSRTIPASLQAQGQQQVDKDTFPDVLVTANGRVLELTGTIDKSQNTEPLFASLSAIDGVIGVRDGLDVIDPEAQAQRASEQFESALRQLDFAAIAFQPGSTSFTTQSDTALMQLFELLNAFPQSRVRIEGHTDNTGPDSVNLRVSRNRAQAVANFLIARGIAPEQLIVTGYGATQPIADNTTEAGRSQNRRIEVNPVL